MKYFQAINLSKVMFEVDSARIMTWSVQLSRGIK